MAKTSISYRDAGVDIDAGNALARTYTQLMQTTYTPGVLPNAGGFGALFRLKGRRGLFGSSLRDPVLVSGTDGVGTKLKIAFALDRHESVGIDLVAMSVNDVLVQGAEPLFFLDYVATGRVEKRVLPLIVRGVAAGCRLAGCSLLGGETAELPGFYQDGEYDLAGFAVGLVERRDLINGKRIEPGDVLLGLPSSGLHSNGYSLARKALLEAGGLELGAQVPCLGRTLGEELLEPTRIYVRPVIGVLRSYRRVRPVHGIVHVTGGGLLENVPRILPADCDAEFRLGSWPVPPVFSLVQECGNVEPEEMLRVFNMGLGMVLVVARNNAEVILRKLKRMGCPGIHVGRIVRGKGKVRLQGKLPETASGAGAE